VSAGAWAMAGVVVTAVGALALLVAAWTRSIRVERTAGRSVWREFALSIVLGILFLSTWFGQLVAEWQIYTDEQRSRGEPTEIGDFAAQFAQSTLENWQSEFLQLFSFVVLAALYIHKGSGESKDGDEKIEASLRRIEDHLGTTPPTAPTAPAERWKLPDTPLEVHDEQRRPGAVSRGRAAT
jgi:hypothetical protein